MFQNCIFGNLLILILKINLMSRSFFLSILTILITVNLSFGKEVSRETAEKVAFHFIDEQYSLFGNEQMSPSFFINSVVLTNQSLWVINFNQGWAIVPADDVLPPVLGYNFEGSFPSEDKIGYNLGSWLQMYVDQIAYALANNLVATEEINREWNKYKNEGSGKDEGRNADSEVEPLLSCLWNQDNPYNLLCPEDDQGPGGHVYVGCVATAMSQIMYYWRYPNSGSGQHSYYKYPYGTISANFGDADYIWDNMQDNIDPNNPWEIAEIGFHAGVSVDMNYGPDGSGSYSWDVPYALRTYFNYDNSVQYVEKSNYSFSTWESMIQTQLDDGQPLYYSGFSNEGGHAFVFDGYQGSNYYHINFGWSGSGNGYYTLQDVGGFNSGQGMVRNIFPDDPNFPYYADGEYELTAFSGSFTDGSSPVYDYQAGTTASWLINPQTEYDSVSNIKLEFKEFSTAASDKVKVYGGNSTDDELLGEYSGSDLPPVINYDGNQMLITFSSSGTGEGFRAEYTTSTPTWCSGSQTYNEPAGIISDGSGDFYYSNGITCISVIQHPEAVNITLEFTEFDTEEGKDKVQVYNANNQLLGEFSGNTLPALISDESGGLIIVWSTNASVRGQGWEALYTIDGVGMDEKEMANEISVFPNPAHDVLNIEVNSTPGESAKLMLTSLNGQVLWEKQVEKGAEKINTTLNTNNYPKGIYHLSVISSNGKYDKKIIIQ